ncbi:hypothetical protein [Paenibacillus alvei]|uniref:hypothetical protein n=1 Tax=Paenibacillus alvei TaxID=44250 RepID=UPI0019D54F68|nr:hypothetical protein [Paenibacillus alvei]MCY9582961.1 hypothetical protein [Paenibacillus alvei]
MTFSLTIPPNLMLFASKSLKCTKEVEFIVAINKSNKQGSNITISSGKMTICTQKKTALIAVPCTLCMPLNAI